MTDTPTTPEATALDYVDSIAPSDRMKFDWDQYDVMRGWDAGFAAGRTQALEEAATLIEAQESPFHFVPDTETFWRAKAILARSIRAAATQTGDDK